jgi:hypothetical protein
METPRELPLRDLIRNAACMADEGRYLATIEHEGRPPAVLHPIITGGPFATTAQSAGSAHKR